MSPLAFLLTTAGLVGAERLRRQSRPVEDARIAELCQRLAASLKMKISRRVAVAVCDRIVSPILVGILRPLILLPAAALAGWDPQQLEMVLLHELVHVRRYDNLVNLMQRIIESVLFFHPMVWVLSTWVRREREHCCDAAVVDHTRQPLAYAQLLVALAEQVSRRSPPGSSLHPQVVSSMAQQSLVGRIRRILKKEEQPMQISLRTAGLLFAGLLALAGLIVAHYALPIFAADPPAASKSDDLSGAPTWAQPTGTAGKSSAAKSQSAPDAAEWSQTLNGLRVRLRAPKGMKYRRGAVLPLEVEVQNNSDKPIACNQLWHTVRFLAHDGDGKWLGIPWMGPELGDWVGQSADLAPGQTTQLRLSFQSLRFNRPLKAGETIQLQAGAPTQQQRPNQLPLEVMTSALSVRVQDAFPPAIGDADFPRQWQMSMACQLDLGLMGSRSLQVGVQGTAKLWQAYQRNGQVIKNCRQVTLPGQRLKELAAELRRMQAWKLSQVPQEIVNPDESSIRVSLLCASGASVVGQFPNHLESKQPIVSDLRRLVEGLIGDIEKADKPAGTARPSSP